MLYYCVIIVYMEVIKLSMSLEVYYIKVMLNFHLYVTVPYTIYSGGFENIFH